MKILITGSTGFVGSHLAERLVQEGYDVKALARPSSNTSLLESLDVEIVKGDVTDIDAVEKAVRGCQHVYHLAAKTSTSRTSKQEFCTVNIKGTENVARAASKYNVERLVHCSTVGVYGNIKNPPVDENTQPNPNTMYRQTKLLGEQQVLSAHKKEGLPVVVARITSVFGPRAFNWLGLFQAISRKRFRMIGKGENHNHLCYVSDVVEGIRRCGEVAGIEGETYLISGSEPIKVKELVEAIAQELGIDSPSGNTPSTPFHAFNYLAELIYKSCGVELPGSHRYELFITDRILNISKAQKELGYLPKVSMREGIQQTLKWYRENGYI